MFSPLSKECKACSISSCVLLLVISVKKTGHPPGGICHTSMSFSIQDDQIGCSSLKRISQANLGAKWLEHKLYFLWPKWCDMVEGEEVYAGERAPAVVPVSIFSPLCQLTELLKTGLKERRKCGQGPSTLLWLRATEGLTASSALFKRKAFRGTPLPCRVATLERITELFPQFSILKLSKGRKFI